MGKRNRLSYSFLCEDTAIPLITDQLSGLAGFLCSSPQQREPCLIKIICLCCFIWYFFPQTAKKYKTEDPNWSLWAVPQRETLAGPCVCSLVICQHIYKVGVLYCALHPWKKHLLLAWGINQATQESPLTENPIIDFLIHQSSSK